MMLADLTSPHASMSDRSKSQHTPPWSLPLFKLRMLTSYTSIRILSGHLHLNSYTLRINIIDSSTWNGMNGKINSNVHLVPANWILFGSTDILLVSLFWRLLWIVTIIFKAIQVFKNTCKAYLSHSVLRSIFF